jgi:hypothetical protein
VASDNHCQVFTAILGIVGGGAHNFFITSLLVINALITFTHFSF